jgi:hypothetical protein
MMRQEMLDKINTLTEEKRDLTDENREMKSRLRACTCSRSGGFWDKLKALLTEHNK